VTQPQIARWEKTRYCSTSLSTVESVARALGLDLQAVAGLAPLYAAESPAGYRTAPPGVTTEALGALGRTGADAEAIAAFCRLRGIDELALFGSVLREDFSAESDVDVLVSYSGDRRPVDFDELADTERALAGLLRRRVDVVERHVLEHSENYLRRKHILGSARPVYVAR
jgi:hypothetical protein